MFHFIGTTSKSLMVSFIRGLVRHLSFLVLFIPDLIYPRAHSSGLSFLVPFIPGLIFLSFNHPRIVILMFSLF